MNWVSPSGKHRQASIRSSNCSMARYLVLVMEVIRNKTMIENDISTSKKKKKKEY